MKQRRSVQVASPLNRFDEDGDALAAADAGGADGALSAAAMQLIQKVRGNAGSRGRERVAHGDGASVDVALIARQAQLFFDGEILRREGFVDLEEVEVLQLRLMTVERATDGRRRSDAHDRRVAARNAPADQLAQRLQAALVGEGARRKDERSSAVADAARRPRVDDAVLLEHL